MPELNPALNLGLAAARAQTDLDDAQFDRTVSSNEARLAKKRLLKYYEWRFGALPPADWQADHQVEQNARCYLRFGPDYVHNIANLILVPPDVNAGKNKWYQRSWEKVLRKYQVMQVTRISTEKTAAEREAVQVRDGLFLVSEFMDDTGAFVFLTRFSRDCLLRLIEMNHRRSWKRNPPNWLKDEPVWLDRLIDEVENHMTYVRKYRLSPEGRKALAEVNQARARRAPPQEWRPLPQEALRELFAEAWRERAANQRLQATLHR